MLFSDLLLVERFCLSGSAVDELGAVRQSVLPCRDSVT